LSWTQIPLKNVDEEMAAAKKAILDWVASRANRDFILVTYFGVQPVCDAIEIKMTKLCREESEIASLLRGLPIELSFNAIQKKTI
jgi:hypothetical protein